MYREKCKNMRDERKAHFLAANSVAMEKMEKNLEWSQQFLNSREYVNDSMDICTSFSVFKVSFAIYLF